MILPLPFPATLTGSSDTGSAVPEVRPVEQWIEMPGSGVTAPGVAIPLSFPGSYYEVLPGNGTLAQVWLRRDAGAGSTDISGAVYLNGEATGFSITIGAGNTEASMQPAFALSAGDSLRVYIGTGGAEVPMSGMVKVNTGAGWVLYRLTPATAAPVWSRDSGGWSVPTAAYVKESGSYVLATGVYRKSDGLWLRL